MTRDQARSLAKLVAKATPGYPRRLKAVHVVTRLHDGMLTIRCYFRAKPAHDAAPYIFNAEEL